MHGHGFALMYLASVYGMETNESLRKAITDAVVGGVNLTARGQSAAGGWTYIPGSGDEGSVTVTQVQALRAAQNPASKCLKGTIENAVRYMERCSTPGGRHLLFARLRRRRPAVGDFGRGGGHAVQRRRIRFAAREPLLGLRLAALRGHQRLEQARRPRFLYAPVRLAGVLHGRRQILGQVFSHHPR